MNPTPSAGQAGAVQGDHAESVWWDLESGSGQPGREWAWQGLASGLWVLGSASGQQDLGSELPVLELASQARESASQGLGWGLQGLGWAWLGLGWESSQGPESGSAWSDQGWGLRRVAAARWSSSG